MTSDASLDQLIELRARNRDVLRQSVELAQRLKEDTEAQANRAKQQIEQAKAQLEVARERHQRLVASGALTAAEGAQHAAWERNMVRRLRELDEVATRRGADAKRANGKLSKAREQLRIAAGELEAAQKRLEQLRAKQARRLESLSQEHVDELNMHRHLQSAEK